MNTNELNEKAISSEEVYSGCLLHVFRDQVIFPNKSTSVREVIHHNGAVCVVPLTDNNEVIMEKQFRYPFGEVLTEIPAGKLDSPDEDPLSAAKRELKEETGYTADKWIYLGIYYPTVAYSNEKIHMFLCRGLHEGEQSLDPDEYLQYYAVPLEQLIEDVENNKIPDGKTQLAILKTARKLGM